MEDEKDIRMLIMILEEMYQGLIAVRNDIAQLSKKVDGLIEEKRHD